MIKAIIKKSDGYVENIIEIEDGAQWKPSQGCYLVDAGNASQGDTWTGTKFIKPVNTPTAIVNYKTEWQAADTVDKKLAVLAKATGLE